MQQVSEQKSMVHSRVAFKENPKQEGEGVIILMDEQRDFDKSAEIIFDQHKFERYVPNCGFSLVFWIYFTSLPKNERMRKGNTSYIVLFVRNRFTAELTVGVKDNFLFLEINTPKKEKAYSEKELKNHTWYQVAITAKPEAELSELTLFLNGKPDSTITYDNTEFDPLQGADIQFGQFKAVGSFEGFICDSSVSFFPLSVGEVAEFFAQGKKELKEAQVLHTSKDLLIRSQQEFLRASYSKKKGVPQELIAGLAVDSDVLEQEEQEAMEVEIKDEEKNVREELRNFFCNHPDIETKFETLAVNFDWLVTVVSVMAVGRVDKNGKIDIRRFMQVLNVLKSEITMGEVITVAKILNAFDETNKSLLYYYDFLAPVRLLLAAPVDTGSDKIEEIKSSKELQALTTPDKQHSVPLEENKDSAMPSPPKVPEGEDNLLSETELPLPELGDMWCEGEFTIIINRCHDCHLHQSYSRHSEEKFINLFNDVGAELKKVFPSITVIGNYEKVPYMEGFDVYVRGLGPAAGLDETGRLFLFSKAIEKRFPSPQEILDKVIILALTYGDSVKMADAQAKFMKNNAKFMPKPYKGMHKHPIPVPASAVKKQPIKKMDMDDSKKTCQHWGCGTIFIEKENTKTSCCYHPGKFEFGSVKGWWPEGWSCCRAPWDALGCTKGKHIGVPVEEQIFLCINHGEVAPGKDFPDSFCGSAFTSKTTDGCMIHTGYIKKNQCWSCCDVHVDEATPCTKTDHKYATYPAEEAKIYFFNPPIAV